MSDRSSQDGQGAAQGGGELRPRRDRWANRRNDGACIYVGNLNFVTGWQELKDKMREVGDVVLVELIVDGNKRPKKPKGSALVTFRTAEDAQKAVATMNDVELDGRKMLVRLYEAGTRPHTIQGNYTREMLASVGIGRATAAAPAAAAAAAAAPEKPPRDAPQQGGQGKKKQQQQQHAAPAAAAPAAPAKPFPKKSQQQQQPPAKQQHYHEQQPAPVHGKGGKQQQFQQAPPPPPPQQGGRGRGGAQATSRGGAATADRVTLRPASDGFTVRGPAPHAAAAPAWSQPHESAPQQGGGAAGVPVPRSQRRTKLFVSNLPFDCNWRALRDTFAQVGVVRRADIITDANGRSRGMGTIVFETFEEAKKAIDEFDGIEMAGRAMQVRFDRDE